jgi:putative transposase
MGQHEVAKGYHCAYQLHYHIVFPVKYRKALLSDEIVEAIKEILLGIEERYEIEMEQIGCDRDHIHVLCSAHPKYAPGQLVRVMKSITAREVFKRFPKLRKELWGGEFWTDGYYVATVGERGSWDIVERYIRKQGDKPTDVQLKLL